MLRIPVAHLLPLLRSSQPTRVPQSVWVPLLTSVGSAPAPGDGVGSAVWKFYSTSLCGHLLTLLVGTQEVFQKFMGKGYFEKPMRGFQTLCAPNGLR